MRAAWIVDWEARHSVMKAMRAKSSWPNWGLRFYALISL